MFEQYTYKQKFKALIVVFVMLSIASYKRSFSALYEVLKENSQLTNQIDQLTKKAKNSNALQQEVAVLDQLIGKEEVRPQEVQQQIVNFATSKGNVSIVDLQPIHKANDENYEICTNQIDLTGNSNQLLQLGYNFEKEFDYSRLASMNFYTSKKNNKTEVLHLKLIFQNYETIK